MKKFVIVFISLITIILVVSIICLLIRNKENQKETEEEIERFIQHEMDPVETDDEFSENIINRVGDVVIYRGKIVSDNLTQYEFVFVDNWTEDDIVKLSHAITENADIVKGKTEILIGMASGNQPIWLFTLDNTSDASCEEPDYEGFYRLHTDNRLCVGSPYYIQWISSMEGIRKLETNESFMNDSETYGIDWYEVWPELEEIVLIESE